MSAKDPIVLVEALTHSNVQAFLDMLRYCEGTPDEDGYRRMFGGKLFDSFDKHPGEKRTATFKGGLTVTSTAAGAYQYLLQTWTGVATQYGFADFGPKNQDLGAVALILGRKALADVIAGRFEEAVRKCSWEWASLPGSPYGQPVKTMAQIRKVYEAHGGTFAPDVPAAATSVLDFINPAALAADTITPTPKEAPMAPFIAAVLPALVDLVPKLGKLFSSGSEVAERNIKAAELVVSVAKEAIGARNEQELLETIKADPQAAADVRTAIESQWFRIEEVGGGIAGAREANAVYLQPGAAGFWLNPAFWVSVGFLLMVVLILLDMLFFNRAVYDASLRTQIITAILSLLGMVSAYWLGTSFSSQRKTEIAAGTGKGV